MPKNRNHTVPLPPPLELAKVRNSRAIGGVVEDLTKRRVHQVLAYAKDLAKDSTILETGFDFVAQTKPRSRLKFAAAAFTVIAALGAAHVTSEHNVTTTSSPTGPAAEYVSYTVKKGDSLSLLAKRHLGSVKAWPKLLEINKSVVHKPTDIAVGTVLRVPRIKQSK
jgi:nucleoid-associated protein YgaU